MVETRSNSTARATVGVELVALADVTLVTVVGVVDEHFAGFGTLGDHKVLAIDVSAMTRMTSFGVRQWLKAKDAIPKSISDVYLLGCPTFFVDQLNMVLNFGGPARVLTVAAPYSCVACGAESAETIDVFANRSRLLSGNVPEKECSRCGGKLELDETPESYFSFVPKYAAATIQPSAAQALAVAGLYTAATSSDTEKPPRIIKLVHGPVTYFRITGSIGSMFRARPLLVGAEGEIVIDLAEVDSVDASGMREWRRLLRSLASQVSAITLVDVGEALLSVAADSLTIAHSIAVSSVLVTYRCDECDRSAKESVPLASLAQLPELVCSTCGGTTRNRTPADVLAPLRTVTPIVPPASMKLIARRDDVLSRAMTDANVAMAGESATASLQADEMILGKYRIVRPLSAGGMAEVFLANQIGIGGFEKLVALKRIQSKLLETRHLAIDMFLNEAKIAGRLLHPNIVQVYDVGEAGGALYLAMEYVRGRDLRHVIKKLRRSHSKLPLAEACYIVREVARALHYAYWSTDHAGSRLQVVHRDVSPHNIILGYDGGVKLLDFGVAMSSVTDSSEHSMIVGKWQYMSPEHTTNAAIDHRSDLFSLGVVLYLLCSGSMPFAGKEPRDIVMRIRNGELKPLVERVPSIPPPIAALVTRMLAPKPENRPQSGHAVVDELDDIARTYGLESSGTKIMELISTLFPEEKTEAEMTVELVRVTYPEMPVVSPSYSPSPIPTTPTQVDVSISPTRRKTGLIASNGVPRVTKQVNLGVVVAFLVILFAVVTYLVSR